MTSYSTVATQASIQKERGKLPWGHGKSNHFPMHVFIFFLIQMEGNSSRVYALSEG